jgi:hypothetical protein
LPIKKQSEMDVLKLNAVPPVGPQIFNTNVPIKMDLVIVAFIGVVPFATRRIVNCPEPTIDSITHLSIVMYSAFVKLAYPYITKEIFLRVTYVFAQVKTIALLGFVLSFV